MTWFPILKRKRILWQKGNLTTIVYLIWNLARVSIRCTESTDERKKCERWRSETSTASVDSKCSVVSVNIEVVKQEQLAIRHIDTQIDKVLRRRGLPDCDFSGSSLVQVIPVLIMVDKPLITAWIWNLITAIHNKFILVIQVLVTVSSWKC